MTTRLMKTTPEKSIQKSFSEKKIDEKLKGYVRLKNKDFNTIVPGDYIRYSIDNEFRGGGRVKLVKYPAYLICMNVIKNVSWSVQLKDPTLIVWVKTKEMMDAEKADMAKVYEMFKAGKLVTKKK